MLWTLEKLRKTIFCYKMINLLLRELKFSVNMYFSYTERFVSAKVEKVLWLQRNDKKVTLLLIYHISGFIAHGFPPWLFHINLNIYLINIWLQPWVFVRTVVIFIDYTLQHLISNKKITNHSIGFLQVCWSLKKAKALEQEKTILWHFVYIWLFHLFLCCIIFYSHLRSFLKG